MFPGPELRAAEASARQSSGWLVGGWQYGPAETSAPGWWGVFGPPERWQHEELLQLAGVACPWLGPLVPEWDEPRHAAKVAAVHSALQSGQTYQVNLTFGLKGRAITAGEAPWSWRSALRLWLELLAPDGDPAAGQGAQGVFAWLGDGHPVVASLSPELFFERSGDKVLARPMKGTTPRSAQPELDQQARDHLASSPKERAENLMITDMIRNDLGRVAAVGTTEVPALFAIEAYPTVWQMTSTVTAHLPPQTPVSTVLEALAPCASITGAPKLRTQQLIAELETRSRGWYTGTLGWSGPEGAHFNVLIRTLLFADESQPEFRLDVGGGIVWDSEPSREYAEALAKSRFLAPRQRSFDLVESLLWEPSAGFFLESLHRDRMQRSCEALAEAFPARGWDSALASVRSALDRLDPVTPQKVRLLLNPGSQFRFEYLPLDNQPDELTWALSPGPLEEALLFRQHKTTARECYEKGAVPGVDQTLFWNARGELTESSSFNVVLQVDGELLTPALESGLLAGTFRQHLLARGIVREAILPISALEQAGGVWFINSVRRWKKGKPPRPTLR
ncbi:MAG: chorismate-binding protein [Spirochaetales bacterium]